MKKIIVSLIALIILAVAAGAVISADKNQVSYVCNCADDCTCNSLSHKPGECACGRDLVAMHALEIEKNTAVLSSTLVPSLSFACSRRPSKWANRSISQRSMIFSFSKFSGLLW